MEVKYIYQTDNLCIIKLWIRHHKKHWQFSRFYVLFILFACLLAAGSFTDVHKGNIWLSWRKLLGREYCRVWFALPLSKFQCPTKIPYLGLKPHDIRKMKKTIIIWATTQLQPPHPILEYFIPNRVLYMFFTINTACG